LGGMVGIMGVQMVVIRLTSLKAPSIHYRVRILSIRRAT
jgi:hypothetical protein